MRFEKTKSDSTILWVSPSLKLTLKVAADRKHPTMVELLEGLVAKYCEKHRIVHPTKQQRHHHMTNKSRAKVVT